MHTVSVTMQHGTLVLSADRHMALLGFQPGRDIVQHECSSREIRDFLALACSGLVRCSRDKRWRLTPTGEAVWSRLMAHEQRMAA